MTSVTAIKKECLTCPCFKVKGCSECDYLRVEAGSIGDESCAGEYPQDCMPEDCAAARDDLLNLQTNAAVAEILREWKKASESEHPVNSPYETYGLLAGYLADLLVEIPKAQTANDSHYIREVFTEIAATALRSILDLCPPDVTNGLEDVMGLEAGSLAGKDEEAPVKSKEPIAETCGSCDHGQYSEGGDNGTVACGRDCTLRNKTDRACAHWILFHAGPKVSNIKEATSNDPL